VKVALTGRVWWLGLKRDTCGIVESKGSKTFFLREGLHSFIHSFIHDLNGWLSQPAGRETFFPVCIVPGHLPHFL